MLNKVSRFFSVLHFIWASVIFLITMILVLPFILLSTLLLRGKSAQDTAFVFIRIWAWLFSTLSLFHCRIRNKALSSSEQAFIYVANHSSFLDAVMLVRALPQSFKPLGKVEMAKAPIFGMIYRKVVVMIDRSCKESRDKCVHILKEEVSSGQSILIFPEGTMNRSERPLTEFYDGAFRIAIDTQTPLAPVVLVNARKLLPRTQPLFRIKPGTVTAVFAEPVAVEGMTMEDVPKLKKKVYDQMEALLIAHS
ncbi:MAG TPA: lysophospholipid acyltransferase family protein [Sphingobacteriaceae bacterium]